MFTLIGDWKLETSDDLSEYPSASDGMGCCGHDISVNAKDPNLIDIYQASDDALTTVPVALLDEFLNSLKVVRAVKQMATKKQKNDH